MSSEKEKFDARRKILEAHLEKFNELRNQGKIKEAMEQYAKTIEYARKSINLSLKVLDNSVSKIASLDSEKIARIKKISENTSAQLNKRDILKDLLKDSNFFSSQN